MSNQILSIIQIVLAVLLVGLILLQVKGTGLGSTFGGGIGFYSTKRGVEKMLFIFTIIVSTFLLVVSVLGLIA